MSRKLVGSLEPEALQRVVVYDLGGVTGHAWLLRPQGRQGHA